MIWSLVMGVLFQVMLLTLSYSKAEALFGGLGITIVFLLCDILRKVEKIYGNQAGRPNSTRQ